MSRERNRAVDNHQDPTAIVVRYREPVRDTPTFQHELVAGNQSLDLGLGGALRLHGRDGAQREVDRLKPLLDVQRARLTIESDPIPIEETIGDVARLLNLGNHETGPQRMYRASRDEDAIADARLELVQTQLGSSSPQLSFKRRTIETTLEPGVDDAPRLGMEHDPSFGLAQVGWRKLCGAAIVGMDLKREYALSIEQFEQQRKTVEACVDAEQCGGMVADKFVERGTGEGSVGYDALVRATVAQLPALGVVVPRRELAIQLGRQSSAAPNIATE
jgi:hypothetical protein